MAKTKGTPGPKKKYGKRRDFHILLSDEVKEGQTMSLAEAFDQVAKANNGVVEFVTNLIQNLPEIQDKLYQQGK